MNTTELAEVVSSVLVPAGFRRRKDTWYSANEDTIILLNLQKSRYGGQYFVNLAVYFRDLGTATSPLEHQSHIRVRLTAIAGNEVSAIDEALDLERPNVSTEQRRTTLMRALTTIALPFLNERSVLPRVRELHAQGRLGPVLITRATVALLERMPA
jgi:uncharacterized protein DUF4304